MSKEVEGEIVLDRPKIEVKYRLEQEVYIIAESLAHKVRILEIRAQRTLDGNKTSYGLSMQDEKTGEPLFRMEEHIFETKQELIDFIFDL